MSDNWMDDPTAKQWAQHVIDDMVPKMKGSALVVQLVPPEDGDVKFWVELGASIMLGKPIIALVLGDRELPPKLELIADEVVRLPDGINPEGSDELAAAIERLIT